ncbi:minor tail protein [Streptomyces phage Vorvolakos]|uniref:Minor tail protein n=3 Tax=Flowerpowervirus flowerpower TaxID=2846396 RepID=A0A2U8UND0_9CAUD|nr:peptidase [Streptomyces phage FlowerPower]QEA11234.1 minor tail protein [Streptomyces phage Geostin]QFP94730.1 minor tail protein [Streptomyces phage Fabian]QZD97078.1 minor tail protein [Streptomyces phage RetrieverFever]UOW93245.1 minor tail protein [Streptomyces phage Vorvolakos]AWN05113.1 minor tail protein [Streptomyces phage FlowerPower]
MAVNGADIADWAKQWTGTPYVWGGNSLSSGVDCSGLVQQIYKHFGVNVSRTTYSQIGEGKSVGMNELQAGDMVFFDTNPNVKGPDHVGIYLGGGKMIHAPRPGKNVEIVSLTSGYYQNAFMGGRRVSGIEGGGKAGDWDPSDTKNLSPEELAASYGWAYGFLKSNKELRGLFDQAVKDSWSADKFQAKLRDTNWWKKNSDTMRKAQAEKQTDPATYNAKVSAVKVQVQQLAAEMGASIPPGKLGKIVEQVITTGLDEAGLRNVLGGYITFQKNGSTLNGEAGQYENNIRQFAYTNGVSLDKQAIKNQAQLIARGMATEQDFKNQIVNQAISLYPGYAQQLQAGQTMMDIASPYMQTMAEDLEIPYTQIKLTDPLIKRALNGVNNQGKPVGLDATSFQQLIRNDPRWRKTSGAQDGVMATGLKVLRDMGMIGGQ